MSSKILHIVTHDKFTMAYINFMKIYMKDYNHFFLISDWCNSEQRINRNDLVDYKNIIMYQNGRQLVFGREIRRILRNADIIIVSGIFGIEQLIYFWPRNILKKIYLHYWGGDFYQMREKVSFKNCRGLIQRYQLKYCMRKTYGAIFLIDGEYEKYERITKINKEHVYVAPMPYDTYKTFPFKDYREKKIQNHLRIVVGNSATPENNHALVFEMMKHLKGKDIEVYCPLSYGDENYRKEVEKLGREYFGERFHPVTKWMKKEEYYQFLATCDIGVFGNDRQQGLWNIGVLLYMGRKVYLKEGTSMYDNYKKLGFVCYNIEDIRECDSEKISIFPEKNNNIELADNLYNPIIIQEQWLKVFESI